MREEAIKAMADRLLDPVTPKTIVRTPFIDWIALTDAQAVVALDALLVFLTEHADDEVRIATVVGTGVFPVNRLPLPRLIEVLSADRENADAL